MMSSECKKKRPRPSYKQAVEDKCKECIYDPFNGVGTWREQTESCTATSCPLYVVRPVSKPKKRALKGHEEAFKQ